MGLIVHSPHLTQSTKFMEQITLKLFNRSVNSLFLYFSSDWKMIEELTQYWQLLLTTSILWPYQNIKESQFLASAIKILAVVPSVPLILLLLCIAPAVSAEASLS